MNILERRAEIKEAIWLLHVLNGHAKLRPDQKWLSVSEGVPYNDEALAAALNVPTKTARKWRLRLERVGLIRSFPTTPRKRRFEVLNFAWKEDEPSQLPEPPPSESDRSKPNQVIQ